MNISPTPAAPNPVQEARALLKELQKQFKVFEDSMPLAIGIDKQLAGRRPDINRKLLRIALGLHTNSVRYLRNMEKAATRFDLDGKEAEALSDAHRTHAAKTVRERFKKEAERRRVQREEEDAARRRADKLQQLAAKFAHPKR